jgi:hypothetical protein
MFSPTTPIRTGDIYTHHLLTKKQMKRRKRNKLQKISRRKNRK